MTPACAADHDHNHENFNQYVPLLHPLDVSSSWKNLISQIPLPVSMKYLPEDQLISGKLLEWAAQHETRFVPDILAMYLSDPSHLPDIPLAGYACFAAPQYLQALIDRQADPNKPWSNLPPLFIGSSSDHALEIMAILLDSGVDIDQTTLFSGEELTVGMDLLRYGQPDIKLIDFLSSRGLDFTKKNNVGSTCLHHAAAAGCSVEILKKLLDLGCGISTPNNGGKAPFHTAQNLAIESLIKLGADKEIRTPDGSTALHLASLQGSRPHVEELIRVGCDIDAKTKRGLTPLCYAVTHSNAVADILVKHGANPNAENLSGHSVAWFALNGHAPRSTFQLLLQAGLDPRASSDGGKQFLAAHAALIRSENPTESARAWEEWEQARQQSKMLHEQLLQTTDSKTPTRSKIM